MTPLRPALAALLAALVLSSCQDDPEPQVADPTPTPTSSAPEPTPSESVSTSPAAQTLSPEETVAAWVDARNAALLNGDTSAVDALSSANCRSCKELNSVIRDVYAAGGMFDGGEWTIKSLKMKAGVSPPQVDTALVFAPGETVPSAGADPVSYDDEKHIVTFKLSRTEAGLRVTLVLFLS